MNHTPSENSLIKQTLAPQVVAAGAAVNGTGVDCQGFESALVDIEVGAIVAAANKSLTIKLQDSADNSTFADVINATTAAIVAAGQNKPYLFDVNLSERARYIRAVVTGGSVDGGIVSASIHLSSGRHLPPTQDNAAIQI